VPEQSSQIVQITLAQMHTNLAVPELQRAIKLPDYEEWFTPRLVEVWLPTLNQSKQREQFGWMQKERCSCPVEMDCSMLALSDDAVGAIASQDSQLMTHRLLLPIV
jgi:hypothetical protein